MLSAGPGGAESWEVRGWGGGGRKRRTLRVGEPEGGHGGGWGFFSVRWRREWG